MSSSKTVKGSHVVQVKEWTDRRIGPEFFGEITKHAGEHWAMILPMAWYEIEVVNQVLEQASRRTGVPVEEISTEVCQLNAERDLTSKVVFPLHDAFWGGKFGMLVDRYGIHWMFSYGQPAK